MITAFQSFDPPPEVSIKEEAAYQKGYREGVDAGRQAMGLYIPIVAEALRDLTPYKEAYRKRLNAHMIDVLQQLLGCLVMPLSVATELTKARAVELFQHLDTSPTLKVKAANPEALKGCLPDFVVLEADTSMASTDVSLIWGDNQAEVAAHQEELQKRLVSWLAETLELITLNKEEVL